MKAGRPGRRTCGIEITGNLEQAGSMLQQVQERLE
jgi:hypothetical protein